MNFVINLAHFDRLFDRLCDDSGSGPFLVNEP
jgi:hypothetical protein